MDLSTRAKEYLSKQQKNLDACSTEEELRVYFERQNVPLTESIINFQTNFSGLELKIQNERNNTFELHLFSQNELLSDEPLEYSVIDNSNYFICGSHATAQFWFLVKGSGEICTSHNRNQILSTIYGSVEKIIEEYAFRNEFSIYIKKSASCRIKDQNKLKQIMEINFKLIPECSDSHVSWWRNENFVINISRYYDKNENYFLAYELSNKSCKSFIKDFQQKGVLVKG